MLQRFARKSPKPNLTVDTEFAFCTGESSLPQAFDRPFAGVPAPGRLFAPHFWHNPTKLRGFILQFRFQKVLEVVAAINYIMNLQ